MSGEELALETQLLLQSVAHITQERAVERVFEDARVTSLSKYETDRDVLLTKLRQKKEANRARQHVHMQRHGLVPTQGTDSLPSPRKPRAWMPRLPLATPAGARSGKKKRMLTQLKTQAIQQGAQHMAKLFGYSSYEEHWKSLNKLEQMKIERENQRNEKDERKHEPPDVEHVVEGSRGNEDAAASPTSEGASGTNDESHESGTIERPCDEMLKLCTREEEDGNEADTEQDGNGENGADEEMENAPAAIVEATKDAREETTKDAREETIDSNQSRATPKDKAAGYRSLLRAEARANHRRKKLTSSRVENFVESEAEEDDDEDVLKIGGLGDFGFGVPQPKTQESKDAEDERNALKLREGDLDYIVDDLSDDERAQEETLDELFRREQENDDRQQVKEVMRNVKEGFGRNRHAFSGSSYGSTARGRFNLDELVAADGSKFEAARLGLLESDEELSEHDDTKKKTSGTDGQDGDQEQNEEEDEEAEMERMLRERFLNQPKIYLTSSESESEEEGPVDTRDNVVVGDEGASDEERERQQMKLFSERARINRRMQRMKDMQRKVALEENKGDAPTTTMPHVWLEDNDSQELTFLVNRATLESMPTGGRAHPEKSPFDRRHGTTLRRRTLYGGGLTSVSWASSSFRHVLGQCKMFSANSAGDAASSKSFVFTSFSSEKNQDGSTTPSSNELETTHADLDESCGQTKRTRTGRAVSGVRKRPEPSQPRADGGLFSALSVYQCVSTAKKPKWSHVEV
ncbi:hypothetical protein PsorP6_012584 [Peronosclerospora sorghi]|uniref:Uncharacterized protein n=1 Tax=Peronosclerospora sorghi TaxID=230839 RepID=A0ACC0WEK2_9STRA|nr:hypothetical protein PsorP6_012584 [Peronosclerospora sorghi]